MYANPQMEQMQREKLAELQLQRLQKTLKWACEKSSLYSGRLQEAGISAQTVQRLADIQRIPFTEKEELQQHAAEFLTLPMSAVMRISRSEAAGNGVLHMYTNGDIGKNIEHMTRALAAAGIMRASIVGLLGDLSDSRLLDVQYAAELLGAAVVPLGCPSAKAAELLGGTGIDTLLADEQSLTEMGEFLAGRGKTAADYPLLRILCLRDELQEGSVPGEAFWNTAVLYPLYSPVLLGSLLLFSCGHEGLHGAEDMYYMEIIEPDSGRVIEGDEEVGELVVTTLTAEAMPVLRLRTGQRVRRLLSPCACGRTQLRLEPAGKI